MSKTNYKKTAAIASPIDYVGLGIDENGLPYIIDELGNKTIIINAVNDKGWFPTEAALIAAYPPVSAIDGWYSIVGATDSVWVFDSGTVAWVNSGVTSSSFLSEIQAAAEKATLEDTDKIGIVDITSTPITKWTSFLNFFNSLKAKFDLLYNALINNSDDVEEGATNLYNKIPLGGNANQVLTKNTTNPLDVKWATPPGGITNIIANLGVGLDAAKPVTGLTIGDIYVTNDSFLKYTATSPTTYDIGAALVPLVFVNDTSGEDNILYQYNGIALELTGDGSSGRTKITPISWKFDDATTLVDPTNGFVNFDNSDLSLSTEGRFNNISELPFDASNILANAEGKDVLIVQEDDSTKFIFFAVDTVVDAGTYQRLQYTVLDSGVIFDDGVSLITTFVAGAISIGSGGHTIQDINNVNKPQETILKYKGRVDSEVDKTTIIPEFLTQNDYDNTGQQASNVVVINTTNDGITSEGTESYDSMYNSEEANINSNTLLSIVALAGYNINSIIIKENSGNNAGNINISLTSSYLGEIVLNQTVNASETIDAEIVKKFFSTTINTDLYISSTAWGSSNISIYITFLKVI